MILSKTCDYGLRAALYLAANDEREFVPIKEISEKLNISFHFLTKILQILTQENILTSFKGPKGGVKLAAPARTISLRKVIEAIDGDRLFTRCIIGLKACSRERPCPLHSEWEPLRDRISQLFEKNTLFEMAVKLRSNQFRVTDAPFGNSAH
jgi:Rrf2 family iron-sulfur cluster assembly transcriptional regulator